MSARRVLPALAMVVLLTACQSAGPVHLGDISQSRATALAKAELGRRNMAPIEAWRSEVDDYGAVWVVTFYRPEGQSSGPPFMRVSLNKHTEKLVAVTTGQ